VRAGSRRRAVHDILKACSASAHRPARSRPRYVRTPQRPRRAGA